MNNTIFIYGLYHPDSNELRYIGKTYDIKRRLQSHIDYARSKRKQRPVSDWVNSLMSKGLKPVIQVIEIVTVQTWVEKEMYWIKKYRKLGIRLLNLTDGGESNTGYVYSEELKNVRRKARIGYNTPLSVRKAIAKTLSKEIICSNGKLYNSMKEAIKSSGVPKSTFHRKVHKKEKINGNTYQFIKHYNKKI